MRICLGLPGRPCHERTERTRCPACQRATDRAKNQRAAYRRTYAWQKLSRATRAATPQCVRCGSTADLTADHVVPRTVAGGVVTLCRKCNGKKGDRT
jgi:5-methylcytosine-specific restriction endonuclease McrA